MFKTRNIKIYIYTYISSLQNEVTFTSTNHLILDIYKNLVNRK